jgi:hypothetical protein
MTTLIESYHNNIRHFFGESAQEEAKRSKFVKRESKIGGPLFLQGLVWTVYLFGQITLTGLGAVIEKLHPAVSVSDQGLDQRFNKRAVSFMEAMFALALRQTLGVGSDLLPVLASFSAIYILDSTSVVLPQSLQSVFLGCGGDGSSAAVKVFLLLDWLKGSYEAVRLKDGRQPDQNMGAAFLPGKAEGALWLFDLGFWSLELLKGIASRGSYFLTRLQSQVGLSVVETTGVVSLDLDLLLSRLNKGIFEIDVLLGANRSVAARLICIRMPEDVVNERRRKAKEKARKHGKTLSRRSLNRLDWGLYVTNAPGEWLSTEAVELAYRIRWQVELAFKLSKTDAGLERTNSEKRERVLCELYAKLISLCLFQAMMALLDGRKTLSYPKAWRRLRDDLLSLGKAIHKSRGLAELRALLSYLGRHSKRSTRKRYPSTFQRIEVAEQTFLIRQMVNPATFIKMKKEEAKIVSEDFFIEYCAIKERRAA